jgi:hypothetical protein
MAIDLIQRAGGMEGRGGGMIGLTPPTDPTHQSEQLHLDCVSLGLIWSPFLVGCRSIFISFLLLLWFYHFQLLFLFCRACAEELRFFPPVAASPRFKPMQRPPVLPTTLWPALRVNVLGQLD